MFSLFASPEFASRPSGSDTSENWLTSIDGQGKRILVIDDEYLIRHLMTDVLSSVNFRVVTAPDGEEGMRLYREAPESWDLVILDMVMPVMNGEEVFRQIITQNPSQRVLICSGYNDRYEVDSMIQDGAIGLLAKPFNLRELFTFLKKSTDI
ncbi:MAG: response regulator [Bacteroidetes bacterium]|nr:response regulator [Bacteroidota bacterium]